MPETTQFGGENESFGVDSALRPNTILMNRYRVLGTLGGGGQGAVYQCRDLNFPDAKRLVAVKEMHYSAADATQRASNQSTFQREANILATLSHPAIPKIFDFFDLNNRAYLVMEYINGNDLEELLSKTKELPIPKVLEWAIDLCDVLQYLHSHTPEPIIFRDIKPANIMVDSLGKVRLIDFGIAKQFNVGSGKHTMIGTEGYSAPEQYKGEVNPLSDIYSLGATLHHIITRKDPRLEPPFSFNERPLATFNDKVPPGLQEVIDRALAMEQQNRFQTCEEMKQALLAVRYGGVNAKSGGKSGASTDFFGSGEEAVGAIQPRWKFKTEDEIRGGSSAYRDLAFVGSYDTNVWAINLETGEFKWKYPTNGGIAATPVVDSGNRLVMFGSEDYTFTALDIHSGRISWSYSTNDRIRCTARVAHDHVFFGSDDGRVYALVAGNGRYLWEYDTGGPVRGQPYVTRDLVIVGSESGEVFGLELSGIRKWSIRARRGVMAAPFVDEIEGVCYIGSFDGYMYAVDASSGYSMWRFRTNGPIIGAATLIRDLVVFCSADGVVYAVNSENAKEKWRFTTDKPIVSAPVATEDKIYFCGTDGNLYCLEAKNGKEIWRFETDHSITGSPTITENLILVTSMDKTLYALPLVE